MTVRSILQGPSPGKLFLLLAVLGGFLATAAAADPPHVITWATNPNYPPYDWETPDGTYAGAAKDLLELIAPEGVQFEQKVIPWTRAQKLAKEGLIDLLVNIRITEERSQWLDFSANPTFPNPIAVFMIRGKTVPLESWDELRPLRGVVASGDNFGNGFDEFLRLHLAFTEAPSMVNAFMMLDAERADYFVSGKFMGLAWLARNKTRHELVPLENLVSNNWIHLGFSKKAPHPEILEAMDRRLAELQADGTLERLLKKALEDYRTARLP